MQDWFTADLILWKTRRLSKILFFFRIANSGENKTMFLSNSTRSFVRRVIAETMESPDRTFTQLRYRGQRIQRRHVQIKTFRYPVGEKPYFDESGTLRKRRLYKVRVVYIYMGRRRVIITTYPELWRTWKDRIGLIHADLSELSFTWSYKFYNLFV